MRLLIASCALSCDIQPSCSVCVMVVMSLLKLSLCLLLSLAARCSADGLVPLVGWSNRDAFSSMNQQRITAVSSVLSQTSLDGIGLVVIFSAPKLSFDSIARYGGVYGGKNSALKGLQSSVQEAHSSLWTGLEWAAASELASTIATHLSVKAEHVKGLEGITLGRGVHVVQVNLDAAKDERDFQNQDAQIAEVMTAAEKSGVGFAAFYTGLEVDPSQEDDETRARRNTLHEKTVRAESNAQGACQFSFAGSTDDPQMKKCLLFCAIDAIVLYFNYTVETKNDMTTTFNHSICSLTITDAPEYKCTNFTDYEFETNASYAMFPYLDLTLEKTPNSTCNASELESTDNLRMRLYFPVGSTNGFDNNTLPLGYWRMDVQLDPENQDVPSGGDNSSSLFKRAKEDKYLIYPFAVSNITSYSCASEQYSSFSPQGQFIGKKFSGVELRFSSLQVQPYSVVYKTSSSQPSFSTSYDCEGYFSLSGWMGIFSVVMLIIIFYISAVCAFSMQTIDRFDDPRGETISVENVH